MFEFSVPFYDIEVQCFRCAKQVDLTHSLPKLTLVDLIIYILNCHRRL
jgi:hypothetical protein